MNSYKKIILGEKSMKKGFTLIELLVVIAIIAILAAILFPVFAQAREKARQTSCLSNCKQIGTALQLYVDDYDETYPCAGNLNMSIVSWADWSIYSHPEMKAYPGHHAKTNTSISWAKWGDQYYTWADAIFPYVKNLSMYVCPSSKGSKYKNVDGLDGMLLGYAVNGNLYGMGSSGAKSGCDYINDGLVYVHSMSEINNPSETVFVTDCPQSLEYNCSPMYTCLFNTKSKFDWGGDCGRASVAQRHNTGCNFTMLDGHAKFYKDGQGPLAPACPAGYDDRGVQYWDPWYTK